MFQQSKRTNVQLKAIQTFHLLNINEVSLVSLAGANGVILVDCVKERVRFICHLGKSHENNFRLRDKVMPLLKVLPWDELTSMRFTFATQVLLHTKFKKKARKISPRNLSRARKKFSCCQTQKKRTTDLAKVFFFFVCPRDSKYVITMIVMMPTLRSQARRMNSFTCESPACHSVRDSFATFFVSHRCNKRIRYKNSLTK